MSPSPETIDREALKARYDAIFTSVTPPFAFVDLDAMKANAQRMLDQAAGLPIRIASKSVRSTAVLRRIQELDPRFRGVLSYTLPEALHLADAGFEDICWSATRRSTARRSRAPRASPPSGRRAPRC